jgi:hypothetical protein
VRYPDEYEGRMADLNLRADRLGYRVHVPRKGKESGWFNIVDLKRDSETTSITRSVLYARAIISPRLKRSSLRRKRKRKPKPALDSICASLVDP